MTGKTVKLTVGQAIVRYLINQYTTIDGERHQLFAGVFGIFGHGNVTCLSEALEQDAPIVEEYAPTTDAPDVDVSIDDVPVLEVPAE